MVFEKEVEMKITLIWPKSTFLTDPMVYPPLGLWYIWTVLEELGHEVAYRDTSEDKYNSIPESDYYFISGTSAQLLEIQKILKWIKQNRQGYAVLGGSHALSQSQEHLLTIGFDIIYRGEVNSADDLELIFNHDNKSPIVACAFSASLDKIVMPNREAAWRYRATLQDQSGKNHPTTTMFTSRGCPERCAFCESGAGRMWGKKVRWNPLEIVRKEIEHCHNLGFSGIMFYDDILPLNKTRMTEILKTLHSANKEIGAIWRCFVRTDIVIKKGGYEYLKAMRDAGLTEILVGVESASNVIKKNISKGTTIEEDNLVLSWCKKLGVKFKASLILGLPGETTETMQETRNWIIAKRPDRVDVNTLIPFPGTPISSDMALGGGKGINFDLYLNVSAVEECSGKDGLKELPSTFWYKGPREKSIVLVGTSSLTPHEIKKFRDNLMQEIGSLKIPY